MRFHVWNKKEPLTKGTSANNTDLIIKLTSTEQSNLTCTLLLLFLIAMDKYGDYQVHWNAGSTQGAKVEHRAVA